MPSHAIPKTIIPGLAKPVSRLVLGVDHQSSLDGAAPLLDAYVNAGGNCFDTAWIYKHGVCEKTLGQWLAANNCRDEAVLLVKGAHTPYCSPEFAQTQLAESLDRLGTTRADIYMLHRDNPDIPAGEFVDWFAQVILSGHAAVCGVSNWTIARIDEANAWAAKHGKPPIGAVSNQFSLARMITPPWDGCVSVTDDAGRRYFEKNKVPLFSWSSQAHGFFAGFARPDQRDANHLARHWYSYGNLRRLHRAEELARRKSASAGAAISPVNIALAYVLAQPFPICSLIGPRTPAELDRALPALGVELTEQERDWLDLRPDSP